MREKKLDPRLRGGDGKGGPDGDSYVTVTTLDGERAKALWAKSEEMVGETF